MRLSSRRVYDNSRLFKFLIFLIVPIMYSFIYTFTKENFCKLTFGLAKTLFNYSPIFTGKLFIASSFNDWKFEFNYKISIRNKISYK